MKNVLNLLDYIFYRSYCFFSSHKIFRGMEVIDAISMLFLTIYIPVMSLLGRMFYYMDITVDNNVPFKCVGMLIIFIIGYYPLMKRYMFNKSISKYSYRLFKEKWGNEDRGRHKKNGWLIILLFIINILIFPSVVIMLI